MDDWQVKCRTMYERLAHILETGFRSDCTFQVGSSEHHAHRNILAAGSPIFNTMFYGPLAETNQVIVINDLEPATFNSLLRYIYLDKADIKSTEEACRLYYAANKYILPGLQEVCIQYITTGLSPSNVCQVFEFAKFYETPVLKEECLQMIGEESEAVLGDEAFLSAELQTVVDIYSLPQLDISSEVVLHAALEKYAAHIQLTRSEAESEDVSKQMSHLSVCAGESSTGPSIRHALHQIRFLTLTPQQFSGNCHASTLLSKEEKFDLIMNIVSPHLGFAIPEGFSTNREHRSRNTKPEVQDTEMVSLLNGTKHCYIRCEGEQHKEDVVRKIYNLWYTVIFCSDVERMSELVKGWGPTPLVIHEDMPTTQIDTTIQQFNGRGYLIASPSLGTRINMKRLMLCIDYEVPPVGGYRHTVARGYFSDGTPPLTISLVSGDELEVVRNIQRRYGIHMEEIPGSGNILRAVEDYRYKK